MTQLILAPLLAEGETYAGIIGNNQGEAYHLILLPDDNDDASWKNQLAWAKSIGGDLPDKTELAMLWNTCRDQFQKDLYWSNQPWELGGACAWCQYFLSGGQSYGRKINELRARAVRRLPI